MTADLHAALLAAIEERERLATAATPGPWHVYLDQSVGDVLAPNQKIPGTVVEVAVIDERADGLHIAGNDPSEALRGCAEDRDILERHAPSDDADPHSSMCVECFGGPWINCAEIQSLARRLNVEAKP